MSIEVSIRCDGIDGKHAHHCLRVRTAPSMWEAIAAARRSGWKLAPSVYGAVRLPGACDLSRECKEALEKMEAPPCANSANSPSSPEQGRAVSDQ